MNTGVPWPADTTSAWARVLEMQTKLHRWATEQSDRRFDDLFNLVHDPAFLLAAWDRVRDNKGGRTAGVDGIVPRFVPAEHVTEMLTDLRHVVKTGDFTPRPVRQRTIPKGNGKTRSLGIPTMTDRIVQASLKLVLEPIFEADFLPKDTTGIVEAIRQLHLARASAVKARTSALNQLGELVITAPAAVRESLTAKTLVGKARQATSWRPDQHRAHDPVQAAKLARPRLR